MAEENKNSNKMLIIVLAVIIVIDLAGTFLFFMMFKSQNDTILSQLNNSKNKGKAELKESDGSSEEETDKESGEQGQKNKSKDYFEKYSVYSLDELVVNVQSAEGNSFLVVAIGLEHKTEDEELPAELDLKKIIISDELNSLFSSQTVESLRNLKARTQLKTKIKKMVNSLVEKGKITKVFFSKFVIQ